MDLGHVEICVSGVVGMMAYNWSKLLFPTSSVASPTI